MMDGIFNTVVLLVLYIGTIVIVAGVVYYIKCQDRRSRVSSITDETETNENTNNEEFIHIDV